MKRILSLVIFILLCLCGHVFGQLKLETEIVGQYYCPGDNDLDGLSLNLKLKYTNVGSQTLILSKDSSEIGQLTVLRNDNGVIGDQEISSEISSVSLSDRKATADDLKRRFVTLMPGETYETETASRVLVFREGRSGIAGAVGNGKHFLQLRVSSWLGSRENADQLQESWKERGRLWTSPVVSEPMTFTVVPKRKLTKCR